MIRQEYEQIIDDAMRKIVLGNNKEVEKELDNLKEYRPIRLGWYLAKAKNMYMGNGHNNVALDIINDKALLFWEYKNVRDYINFKKEIVEKNNTFDIKRCDYLLRLLEADYFYYNTLLERCKDAVSEKNEQTNYSVYRELYACYEALGYLIHQRARKVLFGQEKKAGDISWVKNLKNMKYLLQELEREETTFVLIESEHNEPVIDLLCEDLRVLGKKIYRVRRPLICEVGDINIIDTVPISIDSLKEENGIIAITPVELVDNQGNHTDNIGYLLGYIRQNCNNGREVNILADGWITDDLSVRLETRKEFVQITPYKSEGFQVNLALFFYGNYMDYISKIYMTDCSSLLEAESNVRFSIVIPARNSSATLRYTLQTCLEQTYTGTYEIIVSDNSTGNNASVYNLCKELNDPRIIYLKTPRDLHLPKSFEYAYLHARGEYIFAVGSDDGVLPWALEAIDAVCREHPDEEVIQWERGFYAWPGFNGGQQHQFVIPSKYTKGDYGLFYREKLEYLAGIFKDSRNMYLLPMLYINSCFKRSYFQTLLEKTGRLWDGICQDIYMGVVTASINPKILNMHYPLTIAGMSSGSVGANANLGTKTNEEFDKLMKEVSKDNNIGGFCASYYERLLPELGTDTTSLYGSLLRAISFGILPVEYLEAFDWKRLFQQMARELDVRDVVYDRKIHQMQYAASMHGEEFLAWFNEAVYEPALTPRLVDEEKIQNLSKQRTYQCGESKEGVLTLDASEYGVQNVYDAVQLFKKLMPL